jgi:hypothetical protein
MLPPMIGVDRSLFLLPLLVGVGVGGGGGGREQITIFWLGTN